MVDKRELMGCLVLFYGMTWRDSFRYSGWWVWTIQRLRKFIEESILTTMVMDSEELRNHVYRS